MTHLYEDQVTHLYEDQVTHLYEDQVTHLYEDQVTHLYEDQVTHLYEDQVTHLYEDQVTHLYEDQVTHLYEDQVTHLYEDQVTHLYEDQVTHLYEDQVTHLYEDQVTHLYEDQVTHLYEDQVTHLYEDQVTHLYEDQVTHLYEDQVTHLYEDQVTHLYEDQVTHLYTDQVTHLYEDQVTHLYEDQVTHLYEDQVTHLYEDQVTHLYEDQVTHLYEDQVTHLYEDQVTHLYEDQVTHLYTDQVSCYRIMCSIYSLGTTKNPYVERQRPALGECLARLAAAFPVAYLEPHLNEYNMFSVYNTKTPRERAILGLPNQVEEMCPDIPPLDILMKEIGDLAESGARYTEMPHVIEVTLPMLCNYLPRWWERGPENCPETEGLSCTEVTSEHLNMLLGNIMKIVVNNLGIEEASWMKCPDIPPLDILMKEIGDLAESGARYTEMPHVIEITLPMLCNYLPRWWERGPENCPETEGLSCTEVTSEHLNMLLGNIMKIVVNNLGIEEASWMKRLAVFAQPIVSRAKSEMLKSHFIPTMEKLKKRCGKVVAEEDALRLEAKSESSEAEAIIKDEFSVLCRDLYALYPLLIRYVDNNRATWLTCPDPDAEDLFRMVGEVFIFWSKSHFIFAQLAVCEKVMADDEFTCDLFRLLQLLCEGHNNGEKVMADDEFTCDLFRLLQLLCEGHNNDFQNYLRTQTGNTTTINIIICTVDYLLRLQESISDFYWYYSGKDLIDEQGKRNFSKAMTVAKQVFNSLTEYIQSVGDDRCGLTTVFTPAVGMRGSTPLDVAAASVIDNNELALALEEQDLEKVVTYLASSGLQSCPMLLAKGYPDIGWNPGGGERYLDFLRFAVFVNALAGLLPGSHRGGGGEGEGVGEGEGRDSSQIGLLKELLDLQKDMVVMLLSLLEGNVVNGTIARQMVDMLVESSSNVEMILKFFDMFLKLKDIVASDAFKDYVTDPRGLISKKDFQKAMDSQKQYSPSEIQFLLSCSEADENEMINYEEFANRFQEPAKDIGFNIAVLLTNLSEHVPHDTRLQGFLVQAESILGYFQPFLGRIEVMGPSKRIERIYFEISETNRAQWEMPQVKESKRQFIFDVVNEGGESEKMEMFVNFCEDTIFEMQIASQISECEEEEGKEESDEEEGAGGGGEEGGGDGEAGGDAAEPGSAFSEFVNGLLEFLGMFTFRNLRRQFRRLKRMTLKEVVVGLWSFFWALLMGILHFVYNGDLPSEGGSKEEQEAAGTVDSLDPSKGEETTDDSADMYGAERKELGPPGGLGDIGEPTTVDPPTPEGTPIASRKVTLETKVIEEPPPEPEKADVENGEKAAKEGGRQAEEGGEEDEKEKVARRKKTKREKKPAESEAGFEFWSEVEIQRIKFLNYLSRNFYNLRFLALFVSFALNFILLFYKVSESPSGDDDFEGSGLFEQEMEGSGFEEGGDEDEEDSVVYFFLEESTGYMQPTLSFLSILHTLISFLCIIGYNCLKVPLVIFKREKELARKLEFDGLYITEQPEDDDIKGQWDRLVLNTPSFPSNYWDKFVKRKVLEKYGDIYGRERIAELLGMDLASLDISTQHEKKQEPDSSVLSW
ncbi:UNVERIFIED_CONTAM: hypothetical protein FKN15_059741 [Acipenser sinensis]